MGTFLPKNRGTPESRVTVLEEAKHKKLTWKNWRMRIRRGSKQIENVFKRNFDKFGNYVWYLINMVNALGFWTFLFLCLWKWYIKVSSVDTSEKRDVQIQNGNG